MSAPISPMYFDLGEVEQLPGLSRPERRRRPRTRLQWPVRLYGGSHPEVIDSVTRDLSSDGFYCTSPVQFVVGESLRCMLTLPTHDRSHRELFLNCRIQVVRVELLDGAGFGIACRIEDYQSVPHQESQQ